MAGSRFLVITIFGRFMGRIFSGGFLIILLERSDLQQLRTLLGAVMGVYFDRQPFPKTEAALALRSGLGIGRKLWQSVSGLVEDRPVLE